MRVRDEVEDLELEYLVSRESKGEGILFRENWELENKDHIMCDKSLLITSFNFLQLIFLIK